VHERAFHAAGACGAGRFGRRGRLVTAARSPACAHSWSGLSHGLSSWRLSCCCGCRCFAGGCSGLGGSSRGQFRGSRRCFGGRCWGWLRPRHGLARCLLFVGTGPLHFLLLHLHHQETQQMNGNECEDTWLVSINTNRFKVAINIQ
jgi:hypothetical protein